MAAPFLYISLLICISGIAIQWLSFRRSARSLNQNQDFLKTHWSPDAVRGLFNLLFQSRLLKAGKIRWLLHLCILSGFTYLVMVHALHQVTADLFFTGYEPTIDPYQFLRNLAGILVIAGCSASVIRRFLPLRINRDRTIKYKGLISIGLVLLLVGTGFFLESSKIISEAVFMDMVETYSDLDTDPGLDDLKLFWQQTAQVQFAQPPEDSSASRFEYGRILNEDYCLHCHSDIQSAFASAWIAERTGSAAAVFNKIRADRILYWIHYILCLVLIAAFPYSRLYHMILIPLTSFQKQIDSTRLLKGPAPLSGPDLYACTNCGYCTQVCSVYPHFQVTGNKDVLPHVKIESIKALITKHPEADLWQLQSGNAACTLCHKCTAICPSGIDLQAVWTLLDTALLKKGFMDTSMFVRQMSLADWAGCNPLPGPANAPKEVVSGLVDSTGTFENCIQCTICTNVCPVVAYGASDNDYTPQQVMNLLRLGQRHLASGTWMVWNCLTCYACQEICPQKIKVADILLELRQEGGVKADGIK